MFEQLVTALRRFLMNYYVSTKCTDIFEETLLKMASITTKPKKCTFAPSDTENLYFAIRSIGEQDTIKFTNFFKSFGAQTILHHFDDALDAHVFVVNVKIVVEKILPAFKEKLIELTNKSSDALKPYQDKSLKSTESKAMHLVDSLHHLEKYIDKTQLFLTSSAAISLSKSIKSLTTSILDHAVTGEKQKRKEQRTNIKLAYDNFIICCSSIKKDEQVKSFQNRFDEYWTSLQPQERRYRIKAPRPSAKYTRIGAILVKQETDKEKYNDNIIALLLLIISYQNALAKMASRMQGLSKIQLGLPDKIQALIISFLAAPKKGLCKYGSNGTIIYPNNLTKEEDVELSKYETAIFKFFKPIFGKTSKDKEARFSTEFDLSASGKNPQTP
ncbi:MAG: hypothetical protein QM652_04825 [Legionella sp.]|uniref:hypothetical protein n=1 Tax=Legionella sp. TaxID=459 RepID=UPI0039E2E792